MTESVTITLADCDPMGKQRPRLGRHGVYTPAETTAFERAIGWHGKIAMNCRAPLQGPLEATVRVVFRIPPSWTKTRREAAIRGEIAHTIAPDCDNVLKACLDGLNKIVFADDKQVVKASIEKRYGPQPMVVVTVKPMEAMR